MIVVIDCGMGNLQSVTRGLRQAGGNAVVSSSEDDVRRAQHIVLPGVGSFAQGIHNLTSCGLLPVLTERAVEERIPVLGICLGHQLLTNFSEEGDQEGLGWIEARTRRIPVADDNPPLKLPHMGWNTLNRTTSCSLLDGIPDDACFYFAHSYAVSCSDETVVAATTDYGEPFVSVMRRDNICGVQFHPEKSHAHGITVLRNFLQLNGR